MAPPLYIEARIHAGLAELWAATQDPALHERWDLRFSHIEYVGREGATPQLFRYDVRVLGITLSGTGIYSGGRRRPDGSRTSVLRFASSHPLSLLADGSGYWRYLPGADGVRFVTGYDYRPRWGRFGRIADRLVFRPLMGWATAWSFDRLRLWLERGTPPERLRMYALADAALRVMAVVTVAALLPLAVIPCFVAIAVAVSTAVLLPPLPDTPAARRCIRRRPASATAPALLDRLESVS